MATPSTSISTTNPPSTRVFLGNVDYNVSSSELKNALAQIGVSPTDVHVAEDKETGKGRGFAFLTFMTIEQAAAAMSMLNGYRFMNRTLRVDYATERAKRPGFSNSNSKPRSAGRGHGGGGDFGSTWGDEDDSRDRRSRSRR